MGTCTLDYNFECTKLLQNDFRKQRYITLNATIPGQDRINPKTHLCRTFFVEYINFYNSGVPSITVICDGGWSKRTHKHSYNALGGVAIIIGAETKQLLHIGIRNKYCSLCQRAETVGCKPRQHTCFKNWDESSQAMEADIILEGFLKANDYGVRYMNIIADGDSSVFAKVREEVPIWGSQVTKFECANHAYKCLRSNLEKLVEQNPSYKGKGNLTKNTRIRLVSAVRCAIRMRSKQDNKKEAVRLLEKDIRNSIDHVLGQHQNCSDFCKKRKEVSNINLCDSDVNDNDEDNDKDVVTDQVNLWEEGSSVEALEESRIGWTSSSNAGINPKLIQDVKTILDRVATKSNRLLGNFTSNLAECWMHIRAKFDGGKVVNHCNRGSWHTRCFAAALRFIEGPQWSTKVWEKVTATKAGDSFTKLYKQRDTCLQNNTKSKEKEESKARRWKRKMKSCSQASSKRARLEYGSEALDVTPDLSTDQLEQKMNTYMKTEIDLNEIAIKGIEEKTRDQSKSKLWTQERKKRLTSSNFGSVIKRKANIKVTPIVRSFLYKQFRGNKSTRIGLEKENICINEYIQTKRGENVNVEVQNVGLVIDNENKYLAASPDGRVVEENNSTGLIEIKNVLYNKPVSLSQAASLKAIKGFCLQQSGDKIQLRKTHNYYYQCQGVLNITKLPWLDFVVRTEHPYQLHIERIFRDVRFWEDEMVPKLKAFYQKVLLPELAAPRHGKSPGIREPGEWV